MTKGTQLWPGDRMRAFFLAHIQRETALDGQAAEKLADVFLKAVNRMLVWEMPEPVAPQKASPSKGKAGAVAGKAGDGKTSEAKNTDGKAPSSKFDAAKGKPASAGNGSESKFDPYAFSAMVVLAKTGKDGLMKRLLEIRSAENLKAFAEAQHLGIDRTLSKADELRKAIAAATEQRLADRRAAAS